MRLVSPEVLKFGVARGPVRPLSALRLAPGVALEVLGQPFIIDHQPLWLLQLLREGRCLQVSERVRIHGRGWDDVTMSNPLDRVLSAEGEWFSSHSLAEQLNAPQVGMFGAVDGSASTLYLERTSATDHYRIYERLLVDVDAHAALSERDYIPREDWNASV